MLIIPGVSVAELTAVLERVRTQVAAQAVRIHDVTLRVTLSLGAYLHSPKEPTTTQELLRRANEAVYQAEAAVAISSSSRRSSAPSTIPDGYMPSRRRNVQCLAYGLGPMPGFPHTQALQTPEYAAQLVGQRTLQSPPSRAQRLVLRTVVV